MNTDLSDPTRATVNGQPVTTRTPDPPSHGHRLHLAGIGSLVDCQATSSHRPWRSAYTSRKRIVNSRFSPPDRTRIRERPSATAALPYTRTETDSGRAD